MLSMKAQLICPGIEPPRANGAASPIVGRQFSARVRQQGAQNSVAWIKNGTCCWAMFMAMA
jgi:hypothetical protein